MPKASLGNALAGAMAALVWTIVALLTVVISLAVIVVAIVLAPFDPQRRAAHALCAVWGRAIFAIPVWHLSVHGQEHLGPGTAYVFVSNHQSLFDIMALFCVPAQFKWIAKDSLFKIPFLGWAMAMAKYIRLERGRHGSIRETYAEAKEYLAGGMSVFMFPEGTRSRTGRLLPFKSGAFKLAIEAGVPVVPIVVSGTRRLLRRGSWLIRSGADVRIVLLKPIEVKPFRPDRADALCDAALEAISRTLAKVRRFQATQDPEHAEAAGIPGGVPNRNASARARRAARRRRRGAGQGR